VSHQIETLATHSQEINGIVDLNSGIANPLALNAAMRR
jgi:methyl-accepting chemotaxis protein